MKSWQTCETYYRKNFNVIGQCVFTSWLTQANGLELFFQTLSAARREKYQPADKILVVQDCFDAYDDTESAGQHVRYLQQCLQSLDITNCFVVLISPNPQSRHELEWARINLSSDTTSIHHCQSAGDWIKSPNTRDSFCVAPWINLYVDPQGHMLPCCAADKQMVWGDLGQQAVQDVINCASAKTMRRQMLQGKTVAQCSTCYHNEDRGLESYRQSLNTTWAHLVPDLIDSTHEDGYIGQYRPRVFDLRLNNTCNLKCRTCSGYFSNRLAREDAQLFGNHTHIDHVLVDKQRQTILHNLLPLIDWADRVMFLGGEPLIMAEHYHILQYLAKQQRFDVELGYVTNFTLLEHMGNRVLDYWRQMKNVKLHASIDGHREVFEYVRHGAKWQDIESNLIMLKSQCPHIQFRVQSTISVFSCRSVIELQQLWHNQGFLDIQNFSMHLADGDEWSLQILPHKHKKHMQLLIEQHIDWLSARGADELAQQWTQIMRFMLASDKQHLRKIYGPVNKTRDQHRGENFNDIYPELQGLWDDTGTISIQQS